jgi:hypothetical protein
VGQLLGGLDESLLMQLCFVEFDPIVLMGRTIGLMV